MFSFCRLESLTLDSYFSKLLQRCYSILRQGCVGEGERERPRAQGVNHAPEHSLTFCLCTSLPPTTLPVQQVPKSNALFQRAMNYLERICECTIYWSYGFLRIEGFLLTLLINSEMSWGDPSVPPDPLFWQEQSAGFCRCYTITGPS